MTWFWLNNLEEANHGAIGRNYGAILDQVQDYTDIQLQNVTQSRKIVARFWLDLNTILGFILQFIHKREKRFKRENFVKPKELTFGLRVFGERFLGWETLHKHIR